MYFLNISMEHLLLFTVLSTGDAGMNKADKVLVSQSLYSNRIEGKKSLLINKLYNGYMVCTVEN